MPAVPAPLADHSPQYAGPSSTPSDLVGSEAQSTPSVQPAPAVVDATSHVERHILPRRFLGPMPQSVVYSDKVIERRRRLRQMRQAAVTTLLRHHSRDEVESVDVDDGRRRRRFHVRRKDRLNRFHNFDIDINDSDSDSSSSSSDESSASWFSRGGKKNVDKKDAKDKKKKKKKKKNKDKDKKGKGKKGKKGKKKNKDKTYKVWVGGDGFDIGREFKTTDGETAPDAAVAGNPNAEADASITVDDAVELLHDQEQEEDDKQDRELAIAQPEADSLGSFVPAADDDSPVTAPTKKAKGKQRAVADDSSFITARTHPSNQSTATPKAVASSSPTDTSQTTHDPPMRKHTGEVDDIEPPTEYLVSPTSESPPHSPGWAHPNPPRAPSPGGSGRNVPELAVGLPRPSSSRRSSTMDTFHSAREHAHTPTGSEHSGDSFFAATPSKHPGIGPSPGVSEAAYSPKGGEGSMRPLLGASDDESAPPKGRLGRTRGSISSSVSAHSLRNLPQRLKSALKGPAIPESSQEPKTKTVKWTPNPVNATIPPPPDRLSPIVQSPGSSAPSPGGYPKSPLEPADPIDVLRRSGTDIAGTSTAAQEESTVIDVDDFMPGGVVMRDRVLVKVGRHREGHIPRFDEAYQRRDPCYRLDPPEEYIVGMTMTSVDFYVDWTFSCQERWKGFKRLRYTIPLAPPTTLSVFNSRDMMLCLLCPWPVVMRHTVRHQGGQRNDTSIWDRFRNSSQIETLGLERSGLGVFIMKFAERTRALDWHWYICQQLGYRLPRQIDVRVPTMARTVRLAIPEEAASATISRDSTVQLLWSLLLSNSTHRAMMRELGRIPRIELAWKGPDATLDWVAYDTTITGKKREWALLASFAQALQQGHRASLQARTAAHRSTRIRLEDRTLIEEPAGVEGYLQHKTQTSKELLYVSTNEGVMFMAPAATGVPPLLPKREGSTPADLFPEVIRLFFTNEHRRMTQFIAKCSGIIDFRDIAEVKLRTPRPESETHAEPQPSVSKLPSEPGTPTTPGSHGSGDVHISAHTVVPKEGTKKDREFLVTMNSGDVLTFEAHTPAVAAEWVDHLSQLVRYWTRFHRVAARQEMDTVSLNAKGDAWINYHLDPQADELLDNVWNWCVLEGCRAITMGGRVFIKRGKYKKFKAAYMAITGGSIVTFRLKGTTTLQPRSRVWPLFGAYIYSGMLAQDELRESVNETAFSPSARMYQDGLRSTDGCEDTTFCVRITWPTGAFAAPQPWDKDSSEEAKFVPPGLSQEPGQLLIGRARSRLERDRWIWALNAEKERCTRLHPVDGERLRSYGNLPRFRTLMHMNGTEDSRPAFANRTSTDSFNSW